MQQLIQEANVSARTGANGVVTGAGKKVGITARDVRKVSQVSFLSFFFQLWERELTVNRSR